MRIAQSLWNGNIGIRDLNSKQDFTGFEIKSINKAAQIFFFRYRSITLQGYFPFYEDVGRGRKERKKKKSYLPLHEQWNGKIL